MSITVEEGRTYLLAAIEREKVTGSVQGTMEVADKLLIEIQGGFSGPRTIRIQFYSSREFFLGLTIQNLEHEQK